MGFVATSLSCRRETRMVGIYTSLTDDTLGPVRGEVSGLLGMVGSGSLPSMRQMSSLRRFRGRVVLAAVLTMPPLVLSPLGTSAQEVSAPGLSSSATSVTSYLLPGDALQIRIWREPDLSGDFVVDEEGVVTLPMLGRIPTADISVPELRGQLLAMYGLELRNPSITITPVRRVYVLGEVNRPGLYGLDPTASLASAVALAGGANREGDLRKLSLVRNGTPFLSGIEPTTDLLSTGVRSGDQIFVDRRGWWERNQNFVVTSVLGIAGIVVAVIR